jgi:ABC-type transport system involved in cytochrome bd biosynthesis fused ATPase/permease subunit
MGSHEGWIDTLKAFKIYRTIVKYKERLEHKQTLRNLSGLT